LRRGIFVAAFAVAAMRLHYTLVDLGFELVHVDSEFSDRSWHLFRVFSLSTALLFGAVVAWGVWPLRARPLPRSSRAVSSGLAALAGLCVLLDLGLAVELFLAPDLRALGRVAVWFSIAFDFIFLGALVRLLLPGHARLASAVQLARWWGLGSGLVWQLVMLVGLGSLWQLTIWLQRLVAVPMIIVLFLAAFRARRVLLEDEP
jgi:hypothetical protein